MKVIPLLIIPVLLMSYFCLDSFAGTHLGLASAVKSRVQQLKEENDKKLEESIVSIASDNGGEEDAINHLPVISSLLANPTSISVAAVTIITCSAYDPDNDSMTYSWSATSGTISGPSAQITWTAPAVSGSNVIYCTVADEKGGTTQQSVNVTVTASEATSGPTVGWTKLLGTNNSDEGLGVATDASGNIYVTGWTNGNLEGNINQGLNDIFLVKFIH